jgi:hypothetical protein
MKGDRICKAEPNYCDNSKLDYSEFEAGHILADKDGGKPSVINGRVECKKCNRKNSHQKNTI